jgi:hypothetical protein
LIRRGARSGSDPINNEYPASLGPCRLVTTASPIPLRLIQNTSRGLIRALIE